ncbi:hypothetical protein M404DRAFT_537008 [Pisolithus tinctorius Marx 270]|uniref:RING-type domain-containing protein n=1 Tax=Pisolithus tinctorius Marx 270 TaxID=870435 RepID=A0A0C3NC98_PISTI|nr:hypothetical protein M404DRAFT_537008 [Pisolithus tinctorius Marx 270]
MSTTTTQVQNRASLPVGRFYARGSLPVGLGSEDAGEESSRESTASSCGHPGSASSDPDGAMTEGEKFETISRLVQGSIVTYTAGLDILSLTTGFESCTFLIDNIPEDANGGEVLALFARGGLDVDQFYLVGIQTAGAGKLNAVIVADARTGGTLFTSSVDLRYRNDVLGVDISAPFSSNGTNGSSVCDATALTVAWRPRRTQFVQQYFDEASALATVQDPISGNFVHTSPAETTGNVEQVCPICYDNTLEPVQLECGHTYCSACLRDFVLSAHEINVFPLRCVGDDSGCNTPISIPTIQQFLAPAAFNRLLGAAFTFYIFQRPMEFRFCKTPDCSQIYRSTPAGAVAVTLRCPSCSSEVCSACDDEHGGETCEEYQTRKLEERVDAWINDQGGTVKRCPQCRVPIEKTEGCNRMTCRCGAQICWRCMATFADANAVYGHLRDVHGGY